jgi:hypothetical protein
MSPTDHTALCQQWVAIADMVSGFSEGAELCIPIQNRDVRSPNQETTDSWGADVPIQNRDVVDGAPAGHIFLYAGAGFDLTDGGNGTVLPDAAY